MSTSEIFFSPSTPIELVTKWLKSPSEVLKTGERTKNIAKGENVFILSIDLNGESKIKCQVQFRKRQQTTEQYKDTHVGREVPGKKKKTMLNGMNLTTFNQNKGRDPK
jgi:hypothetical protein